MSIYYIPNARTLTYQHGDVAHYTRHVNCSSIPAIESLYNCLADRVHVQEGK